ncbi:MAG: hypothetical protein K8I82_22710 [Anaerolineae bacterium]|nr:hypothetical protein [Anaerolineae bacterium]
MDREKTLSGEILEENLPAKRKRWLTLTAHAPIQVVAFANYLRFGPEGVRHFGPNTQDTSPPHPHSLMAQLSVKHMGGDTLLDYPDFVMQHSRPQEPFDLDGTTIWYGQDESAHLRVIWVWDFYRLFSGIKIGVEVPASESKWEDTIQTLRKIQPGNQIVAAVTSRSGNILQVYPVDTPAVEQEF